jgi:ABC-type dipeptide/oligopeptide/nickel transport system permease component
MLRYVVTRLAGLVGVLLVVSGITFFLMHSIPGGPFDAMAMAHSQMIPEEIKVQLNAKFGLDRPIAIQFLSFLRNFVRMDFGYSFYNTGRTIMDIFKEHWPYSLRLGLYTLVFSLIIGGGLGIASAIRAGTWVDWTGTAVALFCLATPSFVLAILLQYVFAIKLKWIASTGVMNFKQWILPTIANSLGPILILQRFVRGSVADVMNSNYVRTARAKGLGERKVITVHVLKNALTPVVTVFGPVVAGLMMGSFFIEYLFRIPGIGKYFVNAIQNRDYPMIMATTMIWTVIISITYLITDLVYAAIDPRVTFVKGK